MFRIIAILLVLCVSATAGTVDVAKTEVCVLDTIRLDTLFIPGDCNGDSTIDIDDFDCWIQWMFMAGEIQTYSNVELFHRVTYSTKLEIDCKGCPDSTKIIGEPTIECSGVRVRLIPDETDDAK